jgi:agmatine deiminase
MQTLHSTPRDDGFYMPAEWSAHAQTWMVWPERCDNWRLGAKPAQRAFTDVARSIAQFEPVTMLASARQVKNTIAQLQTLATPHPIRVIEMTTDDAWCRDTGPTFVVNARGDVRGCDWAFNAWGGLEGGLYFPWANDDAVAEKILQLERLPRYRTDDFILEGGAIHVDGEGTLLVTEQCLLNKNRNPHMNRAAIEEKLCQYLSVEKIIWLPRGIVNDETDEHVDNVACFAAPGVVLLAWTEDKSDPQYAYSQAALDVLVGERDAKGREIKVIKLPLPANMFGHSDEYATVDKVASGEGMMRESNTRLAGSYINFYICNGGLIVPKFDDANDDKAAAILANAFPQHRVVQVPGREILLGGGNIHCITQQQPAVNVCQQQPYAIQNA